MRFIAALFAILTAFSTPPAIAANTAALSVGSASGLWRGTVGKQEVMVLLGDCGSSYYYLRHMQTISLSEKGALNWKESVNDKVTGYWKLEPQSADELAGSWASEDGKRSAPIRLKRAAIEKIKSNECADLTAAYDVPRQDMKNLVVSDAKFGDLPYRTLELSGLNIVSFEIPPGKFNVPRLNKGLREGLQSDLRERADCMDNAGSNGGSFDTSTRPSRLVAGHILVTESHTNVYCGGPHPESWGGPGMWDLATDQPVDVSKWVKLDDKGKLPEKLYDVIAAEMGNEDTEAADEFRQNSFNIAISLSDTGLVFSNHLPHAIQADERDVDVPFAKLKPFLTPEGKKALASLLGAKK